MGVVMICQGLAGYAIHDQPQPAMVGQYLHSYDPEAHDGYGEAVWTPNLDEAQVFDGIADAHDTLVQVPKSRPVREDGQPNRPLTAFTIEFAPLASITRSDDEQAGAPDL